MEYVAAGDVAADGVQMLSTGGMMKYAQQLAAEPDAARRTAIVATETGMLHPLRQAAPDVEFIAANEAASCRFMKMITLPKLRDALRDGVHEVKVAPEIARASPGADRADGRDRLSAGRPRPGDQSGPMASPRTGAACAVSSNSSRPRSTTSPITRRLVRRRRNSGAV